MLAKQHTKVWSSKRARFILSGQIDKGKGSTGGCVESFLTSGRLDGEEELICLRLRDLRDPPSKERGAQFSYNICNGNSI